LICILNKISRNFTCLLCICVYSPPHVVCWLLWGRWRWFVNSGLESFYLVNRVSGRLLRISSFSRSAPHVVCSRLWGRWRWLAGFSC